MLLFEVRYLVKPGLREEFSAQLAAAGIAEYSHAEAGNLQYSYLYPLEQADELVLLEAWQDAEAQQRHTQTASFAKLGELKEQYVVATKIKRYEAQEI